MNIESHQEKRQINKISPNDLHDLMEIYTFMMTFQKELNIPFYFTYLDLYNALIETDLEEYQNLAEYLLVKCNYLIFKQLIDVKFISSNYHRFLEQSPLQVQIYQILRTTWNIFFHEMNQIFKIKMLFKKMEATELKNRFLIIQEKTQEDFSFHKYSYSNKIELFHFLINYIFRECEFIENFMERSKVLAYSMTQTEEKYIEQQKANSLTAQTIHQEITVLEDEEKILRLSRKQNDKLEGQKILSKIKTLEKKVHKIEILSHQNYKEALIFNGGYVCSMSGNNISEIFYVLKNCHNKLFRKQVQDDSSIQMYTIQNENILKSSKILQSQHKVKLSALTELKYLQSGSIVNEETDIKKLFLSKDLYYQQEELEELRKINFDFGFMKLQVNHIESDCRNLTIYLMLEIEQIFHDFVSKYLESTWAPQEARQAWVLNQLYIKQKDNLINAQELEDLNRIVSKFPSQVFFVNTKFAQTIHDEQEKHTRQRVFWFYSKQSLSLSFKGVLSSLDQPYSMLYCICLTLYVQLLKYVHQQIQKKLKKVEESSEEVIEKKKNKKQRVIEDDSDYEDDSEQQKELLDQYKYKTRSSRVK